MENAAVDNRHRDFLICSLSIATDEVPSATGDVSVSSRNRSIPMLFFVDRAMYALAPLEPVNGAEYIAKTDEKIRCHCLMDR